MGVRVLRDPLVINANAHAAIYKGIEFNQVLLFLLPRGFFLMRIVKPMSVDATSCILAKGVYDVLLFAAI